MARSTAQDRRAEVVQAAIALFAQSGYHGTKTPAIAERVGVSQPYLFQLYPTKKAMFIAAWEAACDRIIATLTDAIATTPAEQRLSVLAASYDGLVTDDRDLLTIQVHAWAAATSDDEIAEATRRGVERLRDFAIEQLGIDRDQATRIISVMAFYNINASITLDSPRTARSVTS